MDVKSLKKRIISIATVLSVCSASLCVPTSNVSAFEKKSENILMNKLFEGKISPELKNMMETTEEKIPVYIWYKDVDHYEVEKKIEESIGLSIDNLEVDYGDVSEELISSLLSFENDSNKTDLKAMMKLHINKTANQRTKEKELTDTYLRNRRNIVADKYVERGNEIIQKTDMSTDNVGYVSKYAPVVLATLTSDEINRISNNSEIENIALYDCINPEILGVQADNHIKESMGVSKINENLNLTGNGINIGIFDWHNIEERDCVNNNLNYNKVTNVGTSCIESSGNDDHGAYCASIAAGNYGVAPSANIFAASSAEYDSSLYSNSSFNVLSNLETLIRTANVDVVSISLGYNRDQFQECMYSYFEKYLDCLISETKTTIVVASGNDQNKPITSPGLSYNAITVNGFHEEGINTDQYKKVLDSYSYSNKVIINGTSYTGCNKPDVIANSLNNGTSTATPVIAGMIALLYEYKPSLKAYPEITKAIVQASCHEKLSLESLYAGLSDKQGAGIPDMYTMIGIAAQHSYGMGTVENSYDEVMFVQPPYEASNINVALSFMQNGTDNIADLDLKLYGDNNQAIRSSLKSKSSTELIYNQLVSSSNKYKLKIENFTSSIQNVRYGYAWSSDSTKFLPISQEEGLYYLKNKSTKLYMTSNTSNDTCLQNNFSGNTNQSWIIKYNNDSRKYVMQNASGSKFGMKVGATISGAYQHVSEGTNNEVSPISIRFNNDGTYSFLVNYNSFTLALGAYSNYVAWYPYSSSNNAQKWYIESLQWRRGDVNMDGVINQSDINIIRQHISYSSLLTMNVNKFLADANLDNNIDLLDLSYLTSNY